MNGTESWHEFASAAARQAGNLHLTSVRSKLHGVHDRIRERHHEIERIAVALYDPERGRVKTFLDSTDQGDPLHGYECALDDVPSLRAIAQSGEARVLNDLGAELVPDAAHSRWLLREGYRSSLTLPVKHNGQLLGFIFFDARKPDVFDPDTVSDLLLTGHLIGMVITQELSSVQMLVGGLRLASQFAHVRDLETGSHLDRMARYARLIAREVGPSHGQPDDYPERIFLFAPLHDMGKIGVPDRILLKPGKFDDAERAVMRQHVTLGVEMAERLISDFSLDGAAHVEMLRNIVIGHHERMDGSGYPRELKGDEIPLEARIVATADVFDALACARCYKPAWTLNDAFEEIRMMAGEKLYAPCVDALFNCRTEVEAIHRRFTEDPNADR
jgi:HD-GYP domain-containing protein (c-di-GMP phosphodiesterase class II)